MFHTPVSKYFWEINRYNIPISIVIGAFAGAVYGFIVFCSIGILFGSLAFNYFKSSEYYLYQNLGYTKGLLLKKVFIRNLAIAIPILLLFSLSL